MYVRPLLLFSGFKNFTVSEFTAKSMFLESFCAHMCTLYVCMYVPVYAGLGFRTVYVKYVQFASGTVH